MLNLLKVLVRSVRPLEEQRFQKLMQEHHYLGSLPKISETLWYVATFGDQWVALLSFSAAALKWSARDRWIGWDFRHQYDRLKLVTNNSRFLILPDCHFPNLASRILSLCQKRLPADWQTIFGHPLVLRSKPLWTRNGSREPSTKRPTGYMWVTPRALIGLGKATAPQHSHRKWFLSNR